MSNIFRDKRLTLIGLVFLYLIEISDAISWVTFEGNTTSRIKRQSNCDFKCGSGECLDLEFECDGTADCADGSDETRERCGKLRCPDFLFQCAYGACIPKNKKCNGEKNCADNSDEEHPDCPQVSANGNCKSFEFQCLNGDCIDNLDTCDGINTCSDGSDESEGACAGLVCADFLFRCAYGACVAKSAKCNGVNDCADGSDEADCPNNVTPTPPTKPTKPTPAVTSSPPSSGCLLPPHPPNGKYSLNSETSYLENTYTETSRYINLTCNNGFAISAIQIFFCIENSWSPKLETGFCTATCEPLPSTDTYTTSCYLSNRLPVNCDNPLDGTEARIKCRPRYVFRGTRINPLCTNGHWHPQGPTPCEPECGRKIVNAQELVIGGSNALQGEYPWMVGIYNISSNQKDHICGGTIISRFYVVSAAHCFSNSKGTQYPKEYFSVVAGKYYRDLNVKEDEVQIRQLKRIYIPEDYKGITLKFNYDIALLEVDIKFELSLAVQPICVDWDNNYEDSDFAENNTAVVAGWGYTKEGSSQAEVLKKLIVPYRSKNICKEYMDPEFFEQYYLSDKICAGYKDEGTSVCSGDSGGGLYFKSLPTTFYIRGVVSLTRRSEGRCDSNHYALYTKVSRYLGWIEIITRKRV